MFWKTCLDHSFEILAALIGSGILGYLWSRWFGASKTDPRIGEFESQIRSLRDRVKQQDAELKSSKGLTESWYAEKSDLQSQLDQLDTQVAATRQSYQAHVAPEVHEALQSRFDQDIKTAGQQVDALRSERDGLLAKINNLESKIVQTNASESQLKENGAQFLLLKEAYEKDKLSWAAQHKDIQTKESELADLKSKLNEARTQLQHVNAEKQKIKIELAEKDNSLSIAHQSKQNTDQRLTELTQSHEVSLQAKEEELKKLGALSIQLQEELIQWKSKTNQAQDSEQAMISKQNDLQAKIHQLVQEHESAKSLINALQSKVNDVEELKKSIAESEKKTKEWEGRWKEASTESEHFKVAHGQSIKERDNHKQHIAQLESDILLAKNQLTQLQSTQESHVAAAKGIEEQFGTLQSQLKEHIAQVELLTHHEEIAKQNAAEWESKYHGLQLQLDGSIKEAEATKSVVNEQKQSNSELEKKLEDINLTWSNTRSELDHSKSLLQEKERQLYEWEEKYNTYTAQWSNVLNELEHTKHTLHTYEQSMAESNHKIQDLSTQLSNANSQLDHAHQELQAQSHSHSDWEKRYEDVNHRLANAISQLEDAKITIQSSMHGQSEMDQKWKEAQQNALDYQAQLIDLKKSEQEAIEKRTEQEQNFQNAQSHIHTLESKINALEELTKNYQRIIGENEKINQSSNAHLENLNSELTEVKKTATDNEAQLIESESRNKDLSNKLNTVQLQLTEIQREKARMEQDSKKSEDYRAKYQTEVLAWQKRINDLEKEYSTKESAQSTNYAKAMDNQRKQITLLQNEIDKLKLVKPAPALPITAPVVASVTPVESKPVIPRTRIKTPKAQPKAQVKLVETTQEPILKGIPTATPVAEKHPPVPPTNKPIELAKQTIQPIDWKAVSGVFGKKIKSDDHQIVEGIGPKIDALLRKNKITSWIQLSNTPIKNLQTILDGGGSKFGLADPASWPSQARLASMGEWRELKKLQDRLNAGKARKKKTEPKLTTVKSLNPNQKKAIKAVTKTISKAQRIKPKPSKPKVHKPVAVFDAAKASAVYGSKIKLDDLKIVEGIGPKIEKLLHKANIKTWKQLANTELKTIQIILDKAGTRFSLADPKTWPKQSGLAANGKWANLKSLQDNLKGGKK